MTTYYANIDDLYITTGDGSLGNPWKWSQLITNSSSFNASDILYLEGYKTMNATGSVVLNTPATIDAKNISNPWKIILKNSSRLDFIGIGNGTQTISNGIITLKDTTPDQYLNFCYFKSTSSGTMDLKNIYMNSVNGSGQFFIGNNSGILNVHGCSLISNHDRFRTFNTNTIHFKDCVFLSISTRSFEGFNALPSVLDFTNCVATFNFSNPANVGGAYTINPFTAPNCQSNWSSPPTLPDTDSAENDFLEQTIAPDNSAYDITIAASGTFTGYAQGLFGGINRNTVRGIGAFKFSVLLEFTSKPSSIIPSSRKFIYQPIAISGGTIVSWSISTMPQGMTFDTNTGKLEWTPISGTVSSGSLTITVNDSNSNQKTQIFTLAVDTAPKIVSNVPDVATNGSLFNYQPVVDDAENNVSGSAYTLINAPIGMTIGASTGLVAWTPSSTGTFSFTVKVTDSNGLFDAQMVTLVVS